MRQDGTVYGKAELNKRILFVFQIAKRIAKKKKSMEQQGLIKEEAMAGCVVLELVVLKSDLFTKAPLDTAMQLRLNDEEEKSGCVVQLPVPLADVAMVRAFEVIVAPIIHKCNVSL